MTRVLLVGFVVLVMGYGIFVAGQLLLALLISLLVLLVYVGWRNLRG